MTILNHYKTVVPGAFLFLSSICWAVPVGIIDSGTDLKHRDLSSKAWLNPGDSTEDRQDNDSNGYMDDIHGWNFAENNNQIIDYSYLGKFSPDVKKYFEIQLKVLEGTATPEEKKWMEDKRKDQAFIQELMKFGNFVHGTHVAGIAAKTADNARIMAAKIIPTEVKLPGNIMNHTALLSMLPLVAPAEGFLDDILMNMALGMLADQQTKMLIKVGEYVGKTGMRVANCSFGTSATQAKMIVGTIGKAFLRRDLTEAELEKYSISFLNQIIQKGDGFVTSAKQTFFAMAAGNDGTDNDKLPVFPANLKHDNTITVAATRGYDRLASFSNFGATKVEIAAPGVGILSSIPGDEFLVLSGTSQASPFVANLAGKILDINPKLALGDVKKVLMQTVDKKAFLEGKVVSGGIANEERALRAAHLSTEESLDEAIRKARLEITDVRPLRDSRSMRLENHDTSNDGDPIPLPSLFNF